MGGDPRELAAIFAGGFIGAIARAELGELLSAGGPGWPWATFIANIVGAFLLGYFATRLQERLPLSRYRRPLLGTGLCGALTTTRAGRSRWPTPRRASWPGSPPASSPRTSSAACGSPHKRRGAVAGRRRARRRGRDRAVRRRRVRVSAGGRPPAARHALGEPVRRRAARPARGIRAP